MIVTQLTRFCTDL